VASSLRGLFKYLYFFGESPQLAIDKETLNL
jgi:hypothetical protein